MPRLFGPALLLVLLSTQLIAADAPVYDTNKRVPWTSSHMQGAPEPPARYRATRAYSKLELSSPVDLRLAPDGKRWFVVELYGTIRSFPVDGDKAGKPDLVLDISTPNLPSYLQRVVYGIVLHPKFAENGKFYVFMRDNRPAPSRCRISRFIAKTDGKGGYTSSPDDEMIVCEWLAYEDHFGGSMHFGSDGMLYFSVGDGSGYGDAHQSGQDLSDLNASIMRIDVDHTEKGRNYAIPKDNPFVNMPGARGEIWAYGLRNVWKMSFDRVTNDLWACDVGQDLWESVIKVEKGGNYGWSIKEGSHDFRPERKHGPTPILSPLKEHEHFESRSITGGFVYRGSKLKELIGAYLYSDYDTGKVWGLRAENGKVTWHQELVDTPLRVVGFAEDAAGELLLLDHTGSIHRFEAEDPAVIAAAEAKQFPRRLSQTGVFASTTENKVAPGILPYNVISPLWSDGAYKERFLAIPGDGKIEPEGVVWTGWHFPEGTVAVKTFSLELTAGDPASRKRIETRLLHLEQDHWRGYTYLWNDEQTEAVLLENPAGLNREYTITDPAAPGGKRNQTWHFPGQAECTLCHTMSANFVLGINAPQLDRTLDYGGGVKANQIDVFNRLNLFTKPVTKPFPLPDVLGDQEKLKTLSISLVDPHDTAASLDQRARSYLHANCAHCHMKWGGGNAYFYFGAHLPLAETGAVDTPPQHGDLGITGAKVIAPGDPARSLILKRISVTDNHRMPRVGSNVVDEQAVKLLDEWIKSLLKK